ncbi:MAG: alpha-L-fucosidase [Acidobacteriales bacterium]|nr:alpha-L-fucosidase [Terriglobales bacterium]
MPAQPAPANRPDRLEWFQDQGFGMFIHWSMDGQLGVVISHSMAGASGDYLKRYVEELPRTFNPEKFNPRAWARLAKVAGMKYVMFTTKHHSGFCMFDTATTDFSVMNTPFKRDILAEVVKAFREQGIAIGFYFSADDFHWLYAHGKMIDRRPELMPPSQPELLAYARTQLKELMSNYGRVDLMFFDGQSKGLTDYVWSLAPDLVITSGGMKTTEQHIAGTPSVEPFEACFTMGQEWNYRPTNDPYKTAAQMIGMLIETRARGGNLLLNVGPTPDGEIPLEQENRLREMALWNFINGEAIYGVRPWVVTNEGNYWFTKKKDAGTVYVAVREPWKYTERKEIRLASVRATAATEVSVLGQSGELIEYQPQVDARTTWKQEAGGLHIRAVRAQRLYTSGFWPNPVVLKITNVKPALESPKVATGGWKWDSTSGVTTLAGELVDLAGAASLEVGLQYRSLKGQDTNERTLPWVSTPFVRRSVPGFFSVTVKGLEAGEAYEYRAVVKHPLLSVYGEERRVVLK